MTPGRPGRQGVLVALSGGADSTALAWSLRDAGVEPLHLAHVRHGFRPDDAGDELRFLEQLARRLRAPLHVIALQPPRGFAPGDKIPESWARAQRYAALRDCARRLGIATIAVGHQAADRRETQLLHLLRGGGLRALAGIADERTIDGASLWRPLLDQEPEALKESLRARGERWLDDPTNADPRLARNRVRHLLLPALLRAGDPLAARLDRLARGATRALVRIERACDTLLEGAFPCARARCFLLAASPVVKLGPTLLRELLRRAALRLELPGSRAPGRAELEPLTRWLRDPDRRGRRRFGALELERSRDFVALYDARESTPRWRAELGSDGDATADARWIDGDGTIAVRPLAPGDNLMRYAAALAPAERRVWPAVTLDGAIVWVPRLWASSRVRSAPTRGAVRVDLHGLPDLRSRPRRDHSSAKTFVPSLAKKAPPP